MDTLTAAAERRLLWLIPVLLALHNLEEAVTMRWLLPSLRARAPAPLRGVLSNFDYHGFLVALVIATIVPLAIVSWSVTRPASGAALWLAVCVQAVVAINVLSHLAAALVFHGYTPGLATAVLINLPFSIYLFTAAVKAGWVSTRDLGTLLLVALLIHGPVLFWILLATGTLRR